MKEKLNLLTSNTKAALLIILAASFIAGTMILAKSLGQNWLGQGLHPLQISAGRFSFAWAYLLIIFTIKKPNISNVNLKLHFLRSALGWSGVTLMFAAAALIPLTDATAISFLNPVFAMLLAIPFLKESIGKYRWLAALLSLIGAFVLLRPSPNSFQVAGLLALIAAGLMGAELIFMKLITSREKPFQILFVNNTIGFGIAICAASFVWQAPSLAQWLALALLGLLMLCAQTCYLNALAIADASYVAPFSYMTLVFATLYDFAIFSQIPDQLSLIGALIILSGAFLLAWREKINKQNKI